MSKKILAFTMGPIYETMVLADDLIGLWAASYLFSYASEKLVEKLKKENVEIISPCFEENDGFNEARKMGAGFYPDHIITCVDQLKKDPIDFSKSVIEETIDEIAKGISDSYENYISKKSVGETVDKADIIEYIKQWFYIYAVVKDVEDNPILEMGLYLDSIELNRDYILEEKENFVSNFLNVWEPDNSFLSESLSDEGKNDISKTDLNRICNPANRKDGRKIYNYYAFVNADCDNMTSVLKNLSSGEGIRSFSLLCQKFLTRACERIWDYGGMVVYAGGDDLQFVCPLTDKMNPQKTILSLAAEISRYFEEEFEDFENKYNCKVEDKMPSVSFGIEIAYKKFPLREAMNNSYGFLSKAKYELEERGKNAAYIQLRKHAGQTVEIAFYGIKDNLHEVEAKVEKLLSNEIDAKSFSSIVDHMRDFHQPLAIALNETEDDRKTLLNNYFENYFDNVGQEKLKDALDQISELSNLAGTYYSDGNKEKASDAAISLVKWIQFFLEKGDEEKEGGQNEQNS